MPLCLVVKCSWAANKVKQSVLVHLHGERVTERSSGSPPTYHSSPVLVYSFAFGLASGK